VFDPTRLTLARRRRGLTKSQLAQRVDVSTRTIANYEQGSNPSDATLVTIGEQLGFPVEFFHEPAVELIADDAVSFRARASMTASKKHQALGAGTLALIVDDWIEQRFTRPTPDLPDLSTQDPEVAAEILRAEWALGSKPISNLVHLLESHGVRVFSLDEAGREVDAFSFWRDTKPYVFLNTKKSAEHGRFDAAHELGHLVLHRQGERGRDVEHEANRFASCFLMPHSSILAAGLQRARLATLVRAKAEWKVSVVALIYRLHTAGVLTDWEHRSLYVQAAKRGYQTSEPRSVLRERSQVLEKVFEHLRHQGLSRTEIARDAKLATEDLDRLVFGLVLIAQPGGQPPSSPPSKARGNLTAVASA
jgi:Zn-dependent peptidase ImmA (M78 family)/DNA-binding XRE family transcriptional regulator